MRGNWLAVSLESGQLSDVEDLRFIHSSAITDEVLQDLDEGGRAAAAVGERVGVGFGALLDRENVPPVVAYVLVVGEYFDRVNGNSYFGGGVIATVTGYAALIRFQYGRGELAYLHAASEAIGLDIYDRDRGTWSPSVQIVRVPCGSRRAVETLIGAI